MAAPKNPGGNAGKGRRPGVPNKATAAVREVAQKYTVEAVEALAEVMRDATAPPAARVSAATALLDRGHGRPTQPISGDDAMPPMSMTVEEKNAELEARRKRAREIIDAAFAEIAPANDCPPTSLPEPVAPPPLSHCSSRGQA
jgi:hypothetical protein